MMPSSWMILVINFTYPVTTGSGIMFCSNWHITPTAQAQFLLNQCPMSFFNSLFVENGTIAHVMLSTTNVTVVLPGILSFFLSRI